MNSTGKILSEIIHRVKPDLEKISDEAAGRQPVPDKWSKKEILGHLLDSATNNHRRFIKANLKDNLVFDGYVQDKWVAIQKYRERDWQSLIDFWAMYNLHIANVMDEIPEVVLKKEHTVHSYDSMAFATVPKSKAVTLDYLVKDYVGHLEHHLRQILPEYSPKMIGTY